MLLLVFCGLFAVQQAGAVIHRLSRIEYEELPPLVSVDDYSRCMHGPGDVFCFVKLQLHGNLSDPAYNLIVEYSANNITHYDHTHMYRAICPKRTCHDYVTAYSNLTEAVEACLNDTLTKEYKLSSKVYEMNCEDYQEQIQLDGSDYAFIIGVLILLGLSVAGSVFDFICRRGKETAGGRILLSFSVRENWRRLVKPSSTAPMQRRIRVVYALKAITGILVIAAHAPVPAALLSNEPQYLEETYHNLFYHILYNGTLAVQTFFIISAFLLAYNTFRAEEKKPTKWLELPNGIFNRWFRLTPAYALVTFYVMTLARHFALGPFHTILIQEEADACRRDWWRHLLYIHNYKDNSQCMIHTWYLSADFQLYIVGLTVFCLLRSEKARKLAIGVMLFIGLLTPAVHTYVQNLHAVLIPTPEVILNFFVNDPTFNNLYKRGHTNLSGYALGLAFAYVVNNVKESDLGAKKYKKYRVLYWLLFPIMLGVCLIASVFYWDGIVIPLGVRVVYSSVIKVVYSCLMILFMFFTIVRIDSAFRRVLHWRGWVPISRLSYCSYLIHVPLLRLMASSTDLLVHGNIAWQLQNYFSNLVMAYLVAFPLFMLVEAPMGELFRVCTSRAPRKTNPKVADIVSSKETIEVKL